MKENKLNYLEDVLQKYSSNNFDAKLAKYKADALIMEYFNSDLDEIIEMGGNKHGTSVRKGTKNDLDLLIRLKSTVKTPLAQIHKDFYHFLETKSLKNLKKRNISMRAKVGGIDVDFVPGIGVEGSDDVTVYSLKKNSFYNSNPLKHTELVKNSGQQNSIKLLKLWIYLHKLEFESIYATMVALHVLADRSPNDLEGNFKAILTYLASDSFLTDIYRDCNEYKDILSTHNSSEEKELVVKAAKDDLLKSLDKILW